MLSSPLSHSLAPTAFHTKTTVLSRFITIWANITEVVTAPKIVVFLQSGRELAESSS